MKYLGLVLFVIAAIILLLGVISPLNIIYCTIISVLLSGFGAFVLFIARKSDDNAD